MLCGLVEECWWLFGLVEVDDAGQKEGCRERPFYVVPSSLFTLDDVPSHSGPGTFHCCSGACVFTWQLHSAVAPPAPAAFVIRRHCDPGHLASAGCGTCGLCFRPRWHERDHENLPEPSLQQHAIRYHVLDIICDIISHK